MLSAVRGGPVAIAVVGLMFAACAGDTATPDEAVEAWAVDYCGIHRGLATTLAALDEGDVDPSAMVTGERLARAERIGRDSIVAYREVAAELRRLEGSGQLGEAAEARAGYYEARAAGWDAALAVFEESPGDPDFDAGNALLSSTTAAADDKWRGELDGLDAYVRLAALKGAECR